MRTLVLFSSIYLVYCSPVMRDDYDVPPNSHDVSRRTNGHQRHHHDPTFHDNLGSNWDYASYADPKIVDLTAEDPCQGTVCELHEICVVKNRTLPQCVDKGNLYRYKGIYGATYCVSCDSMETDIPACGSNGQTFSSACAVEYQACLMNIDLKLVCAGKCPCPLDLIANSMEEDMRIDDVTKILGSPRRLIVVSEQDDLTSARVKLLWRPPRGYNAKLGSTAITDYIIYYTQADNIHWKSVRTPGSVTSLSITGLQSNTMYYFRIQARTSSAIGPLSDAVFHRTVHILPKEVTDFLSDNEEGDVIDDQDASGDQIDYEY